jgi:hypothetical protein
MDREQLRVDNGLNGVVSPRAGGREGGLPVQSEEDLEPDGPIGLGDVAKAAVEHLKLIVNDSVELGKLEVRRVVLQVEQTAKDIAPRIAVGALAATLGVAGVVLGLIALFIALGEVIPSVTVRLVIFAGTFLALAAAGGFYATRPLTRRDEKTSIEKAPTASAALNKGNPIAPSRPIDSVSQ